MICAEQVRALAGSKNSGFVSRMNRVYPDFPKPVKEGGPGKGKAFWSEVAIKVWLENRHSAKPTGLDNEMAQLVIRRGWQRGSKTINQRYKRMN